MLVVGEFEYKLCAFVSHITINNHYVAYVNHENSGWFEYNDLIVTKKTERQALSLAK